jgi:hypothetical protein
VRVEAGGQGRSARTFTIENAQRPGAEAQHRIGARRAGAAGANENYAFDVRLRQRAAKAPAPAGTVGVVADEAVTVAHDRIDRADGARLRGDIVEHRDDELLARISDVQACVAHYFGGAQELRKRFHAHAGSFEVDELVVHAQPVLAPLLLVQRGRQGALNARANQSEQELLHSSSRVRT